MSALLEVDSVYAGYSESNILTDVSLKVDEGSVVALLGRNGVGKTTTLRTIVGLLTPTAGNVRFDGEDITGYPPHQAYQKGIGLVKEDRSVFPDLTVQENLQVPIVEREESEWTMDDIFEFFPKLQELQGSKGKNLSGGERQMLAIARALRPGPRLLLLDEPSEGLAPKIVDDVSSIINMVSETGTTILIVEQNIKLALDISSYAYIMETGNIAFEGSSEQLREEDEIVATHLGVQSV